MSRRLARETALQVLFQKDLTKDALHTEQAVECWADEFGVPEASRIFARQLVNGTLENLAEIDNRIASYAQEWALNRMAYVDRNVMRLASFEILYCPEIPGRVSLNEAIELAKCFGGEDSAKFVNGILDKVVESVRKAEGKDPLNGFV